MSLGYFFTRCGESSEGLRLPRFEWCVDFLTDCFDCHCWISFCEVVAVNSLNEPIRGGELLCL